VPYCHLIDVDVLGGVDEADDGLVGEDGRTLNTFSKKLSAFVRFHVFVKFLQNFAKSLN